MFFAINKATFDPTLNNTSSSMEKFIDSISAASNSGKIDSIVVYGYASPDGPFPINDKLAVARCKAVADYISRQARIPADEIRIYPGGVAWDGLRALVVENASTPQREAVLRILNQYLPDACTNPTLSSQCAKALRAIDGGYSYRWMLRNLFPQLRYSLAVYACAAPEPLTVAPAPTDTLVPIAEIIALEPAVEPTPEESATIEPEIIPEPAVDPLHRLAVKTNLLYYGALLPNLEVEYRINNDWSVALEGAVAWWGKYSDQKSYRLAMVSPEVRRWFLQRKPWHGLYAGVFAGAGLYDLESPKKSTGYRGEGVMGGLSVGYMWPISRCLSLEAGVGAGYLFSRYKEYEPIDGHHVYQRTKDLNYFGPLKLKFSLVWRLWDTNKKHQEITI